MRTHVHGHLNAVGADDGCAHRLGVFRSEIEDLADLDAARTASAPFGHVALEHLPVMGLVGARVRPGPFVGDRGAGLPVVVVNRAAAEAEVKDGTVEEHLGFAGVGEHQEFMAVGAADGAGVGPHRDCPEPEAFIGPQVRDHVAVVGMQGAIPVHVEIVAVLHQELAAAHHPESRPHLVPELPLDMIERERKVAVGTHMAAEDVRDQFLVGRAVDEVAPVAVLDAQHFLAIVVVAPRFLPECRGLQRRHQQRNVAGTLLLLMDDPLDALKHPQAERHPGVDSGGCLTDHPRPQHQPVADDLGLGRRFLQHRKEVSGHSHELPPGRACRPEFVWWWADAERGAYTTSTSGAQSMARARDLNRASAAVP